MSDIFLQLGLVLGVAVLISLVVRWFRQPQIVGYILAGLLISWGLNNTEMVNFEQLESFIHIGIALLLFMVGLSLNPRLVKDMGPVALVTGLGQIIFTTIVGFLLGLVLGLSPLVSFYVAVAFTFSSTVVITRLLHERGDEETLYGRIAIGFLIVQDLVVMIILIAITLAGQVLGQGALLGSALSLVLFNLAVILLLSYLLAVYVIPRVDKIFAKQTEMLVLFSLAVCFGAAGLFQWLGFSVEMGALLAGVVLASSPYQREIASRIKPLRDFFLVIFFVALGLGVSLSVLVNNWWLITVWSLFILIGNPLIVWIMMTRLNYAKKTSFLSGLTVAQISEFSLILLAMGVSVGHIGQEILDIAVIIGLITIAGSSYMIMYADETYKIFRPYLGWLGNHGGIGEKENKKKYSILLFGAHRMGGGLVAKFKRMREKFLVIDHDPVLVESLEKKKIPIIFGDASEIEFLETLPLSGVKLVVSSVPEFELNMTILSYLKRHRSGAVFVGVSGQHDEAQALYRAGADYVVMPPYLGRRYMADLVHLHKFNRNKYSKEKKRHLKELGLIV